MSEVAMHGPYPEEELNVFDPNSRYGEVNAEDNGTMVDGVQNLRNAVVGHRIVKVEKNAKIPKIPKTGSYYSWQDIADVVLTLDNGKRVALIGESDCCAHGEISDIVEKLPLIDHIITDVGTSELYNKWHILANMEEVMELDVSWSPGNAFYYAYGIRVEVFDLPE